MCDIPTTLVNCYRYEKSVIPRPATHCEVAILTTQGQAQLKE